MTELKTKVSRRLSNITRRGLIVTMYPGGVLGFRETRMRKEYILPAMTCYKYAIQADIAARRAERKAARKSNRQERREFL